jgi:hypothetical protein
MKAWSVIGLLFAGRDVRDHPKLTAGDAAR